jgi:isoamylase
VTIEPGQTYPLGATVYPGGVNFSVYSKNCRSVELLLFDSVDDANPTQVYRLDPSSHRTFHYWHAFVPGLKAGQIYAYRVHGPYAPEQGKRFDGTKILLDPYGRSVAVPRKYCRKKLSGLDDTTAIAMKSVVVDLGLYDWEDDQNPNHPFSRTVIYELHVRGFTKHPSSGIAPDRRGTYAGLVEKIPYLKELGITAVELLPVFQFDPQDAPEGLLNYWGYNPVSFFAPHVPYSEHQDPVKAIDEFRDMVKALHSAGIEVILDVVYNHTSEGNESGPTFSFKGFENEAYYILEKDKCRYANYSGTGNTLNGNHSVVRRMILDSLRYWVEEMHVDGFRFDLASVLSRDMTGRPLADPPILWDIETDPVLSRVKLIAEAWDAAGLYQVGRFFGDRWKDWNGQFRDDVRSFVKSDPGISKKLANRFLASPDIYGHRKREPEQSINFVTCHDGFTINDLVSYNKKHNWANKERNRDGNNHNLSWNCGVEGPTDDAKIEKLRKKQIKNLFAINLLALGTPMILMGDEVRRTQCGNNNAYCHDSELTWLDWSLFEKHPDIYRFVRHLIHFRQSLPVREDQFISLTELIHKTQIEWHGLRLLQPDWSSSSRTLSFSIVGKRDRIQIMLNAYWEAREFEVPLLTGKKTGRWRRIIDTSLASPEDFCVPSEAPFVTTATYRMQPRSLVLLSTNFTLMLGIGQSD